jgi:hypothetical protein
LIKESSLIVNERTKNLHKNTKLEKKMSASPALPEEHPARLNQRQLKYLHWANAIAGLSISVVGILALIEVFNRNPLYRVTGFVFALYTV